MGGLFSKGNGGSGEVRTVIEKHYVQDPALLKQV